MDKEIIGGEFIISTSMLHSGSNKERNHYYYASGRTALSVIVDSIRNSGGDAPVDLCFGLCLQVGG